MKLTDAFRAIEAAQKRADEISVPMNIAIVDEGGNLKAFTRMDNAWLGSIDIAINKAYTARAFDMETKAIEELGKPGGQAFGIHTTNGGRIVIFPGGIPLMRNGLVVGAIGVSGGYPYQDHQVAAAGSEMF
jgi:uncharacterized protein GlcG (DUF336 family)